RRQHLRSHAVANLAFHGNLLEPGCSCRHADLPDPDILPTGAGRHGVAVAIDVIHVIRHRAVDVKPTACGWRWRIVREVRAAREAGSCCVHDGGEYRSVRLEVAE